MSYLTQESYFCHEKHEGSGANSSKNIDLSEPDLKSAALKLIRDGFAIIPITFPVKRGLCSCNRPGCGSVAKHPLTKNGVKDATFDEIVASDWWALTPQANIAIATGQISDLFVLDVDAKNGGFESLDALEKKFGLLPPSRSVRTGGGGLHIYFRLEGRIIKNRVNLVKGIDVRGEGGYVVAPPSSHASGQHYQWIDLAPIAPIPGWLLNIIEGGGSSKQTEASFGAFVEGCRNQSLASIAGFLRTKGLDAAQLKEILRAVNDEACQPALDTHEVDNIAASVGKYHADTWGQAKPLPKNLLTIRPLCAEHLPSSLRDWILDVAERMQVPIEFIAAPALVSAAAIIGRKIAMRPLKFDDWTVVPNLWGFLVAEPGAMKSPAIAAAMRPLEALQAAEQTQFIKNCQELQQNERCLQREIEAIREALKVDLRSGFVSDLASKRKSLGELEEKQANKKIMVERRYKTNDPTVEKLAMILKENPRGILLLRDELSGWLESLGKNGHEGNREFYLEAWNGSSSYTIDRIGRGTMHVEALCVSIFGGIQPEKLEKYINKTTSKDGDDGFLERFQIVLYPAKPNSWQLIDREPNKKAEEQAFSTFKFLDQAGGLAGPSTFLRFSDAAQNAADEWRKILEERLLKEEISSILKAHMSKYRSLMPSLALIFSLTSRVEQAAMPDCVDLASTKMAIEWCSILESHIRVIYQKTFLDPLYSARVLAQKIKTNQIADGDKLRDICRRNWRGLKTAEQLDNAIAKLSEFGWVSLKAINTSGGKSEVIKINPILPKEVEL